MSWLRDAIRKGGRNLGKVGAAAGGIGGGVVGFAVGGPAGAAVGAGIGSGLGEEAGKIAGRNLNRSVSGGGGEEVEVQDLSPQYIYAAQSAIQQTKKDGKPLQTGDAIVPNITLQEERDDGWVILDSTTSPSRTLFVPRIEGSFAKSEAEQILKNIAIRSALAGIGTLIVTGLFGGKKS